jgi:hypothetical protein
MLMNVAIIEKDRDVIVFMLCASNMCSQQDGWPETRSPSRQRAISIWRRSGDHALQCKYKAVVMFLLTWTMGDAQTLLEGTSRHHHGL